MPAIVKKLTTPEEILAYYRNSAIAFAYTVDLEEKLKKMHEDASSGRIENRDYWGIVSDGGEITTTMVNLLYDVEFDGHRALAGAVGNVASLPEARQTGGVRAIFRAQFEEMYEKGYLLSYLFPFSHEFYRQFGYELSSVQTVSCLLTDQLKNYRCGLKVKMLVGEQELDRVKALHERFIAGHNLAVHRREDQWGGDTTDPVKVKSYRYMFFGDDGEACAYLRFEPDESRGHREREMKIDELEYDTPETLSHVLGFLYKLRAQYKHVSVALPENVSLRYMIPEQYRCSVEVKPFASARILNAALALELMRYPEEPGEFTISISDGFLQQNQHSYQVKFGGRYVSVLTLTYSPETADIAMDITTFSQLCIGFIGLDTAIYKQDVHLRGAKDVLQRVFIKKTVFFTDRF